MYFYFVSTIQKFDQLTSNSIQIKYNPTQNNNSIQTQNHTKKMSSVQKILHQMSFTEYFEGVNMMGKLNLFTKTLA